MVIKNLSHLSLQIQQYSQQLGFGLVGIQPITPSTTIDHYARWLENGYAGKMGYLHRHLEKKTDPRNILPEAKSLITLAIHYKTLNLSETERLNPERGQISCYAWGDDYHETIRFKLEQLRTYILEQTQSDYEGTRVYVDTGPILEREYAHRAGLGWFGKHSNLIHWKQGSWFFIAEVLVNLDLEPIEEPMKGSCGTCTRCIDACPTDAIVADKQVDATRCISYLTIELKDAIDPELRPLMGNWIFGCDICQDVCPWNRKAVLSEEPAFQARPGNVLPNLIELMGMTQKEFSQRFKNSPIKRTKRRGFLRNVAIALGNWGDPRALPALEKGLEDEEPLIREHCAWAIEQIQSNNKAP